MKKICVLFLVVFVLMVPVNRLQASDDVIDSAVDPFFAALQSGDVESIRLYVGGSLSQKLESAFAKNAEYGTFLRQHYAGAIFHPTVIEQSGDGVVVRVGVDLDKKRTSNFELLVQKDSAGSWRIVDQHSLLKKN